MKLYNEFFLSFVVFSTTGGGLGGIMVGGIAVVPGLRLIAGKAVSWGFGGAIRILYGRLIFWKDFKFIYLG